MPAPSKRDFLVRTQIEVANSGGQSNLSPTELKISFHTINSSAHFIGDNVKIYTTHLFIGNDSINASMNSSAIVLADSTSNTKLTVPTPAEASGNYFLHANGSWVNPAVVPAVGSANKVYQAYTATADQTVFTVTGGFDVGSADVFYNGTHLANTEYSENGSAVTLVDPADAGAVVEVVAWKGTVIVLDAQGSDTSIQYNEIGTMSGGDNLRWNYTTSKMTVGNTSVNVSVNTSFIQVANSTIAANVTGLGVAAGNSTVYFVANTTQIRLANTTGSANINSNTAVVGNSTVYTSIGTTFSHTGSNTFNLGTGSATANGYTWLPNGILMQWGSVSITGSGGDITFPVAFPTAVYSIQATPTYSGNGVYVATSNTTHANVVTRSGTGTCYYIALGR